ncbi:MAG TPA: aspartyl-phosphate phosphatase Spo0E family protein [Negativicutes bacterium]|nr:aspartyl-phosphate phosphatase Spo0E family protein [Negativicutes bacterium]
MEIEKVRELLNNMIASEKHTSDEILEVSQKLDSLIADYYRSVR